MDFIRNFKKNFNRLAEISDIGPIVRRYGAMNAFDGTLTLLGVIWASHFAFHHNVGSVISAGIGACLAMLFSGLAGTYLAEKAERERELQEMEKALMRCLKDTDIKKASMFAIVVSAIVDGIAPLAAGLLCLAPFFVVAAGLLIWDVAVILSIIIGLSLLFVLGIMLGRGSSQNSWIYGLQTLGTGVATAIALLCLGIVA
jgi:predicted membrane protein (TIGR00267 family)